ncbi:acetyltransferase, GNAT family [Talaromyces proteolyticus]|uniref:Acetyltransferase, GNAT family n=1 Tax=Talaromyces proteolyticus TaxID=1131652 RepID=A0AAD4KLA0_9EURO|nr:acetyltransferase, GNAT family [Talaromyces proteolyticus]KAH8694152.1 acetyltransferase, GNAT family [Talaromyces proteolyticus]
MSESIQTRFISHNDNPQQSLIPNLERLLPSSTPLLRRIQYDTAQPRNTARYLTTANLTETVQNDDPWLAAYVDLFAGRETQVWVYSSLEAEVMNGDDNSDDEKISSFEGLSEHKQATARHQFRDLLYFINQELMPSYLSHLSTQEAKIEVTPPSQNVIPLHVPPAILLGSLHTGLMQLLFSNGSYTNPEIPSGLKVHRYDVTPYAKYVFGPDVFQTAGGRDHPLPSGYYYGKEGLRPEHVELVRSRTHIPREPHTLLSMPSVVIYESQNTTAEDNCDGDGNAPIAWGFLGFDGSLVTLHVEPEHRGKGLAITLSKAIMRKGMEDGKYGDIMPHLTSTHADVARTNQASRRVMEKVGGRGWMWTVTWTVIEVVD